MKRELLIEEARAAGKHARHNLRIIQKRPGIMQVDKLVTGVQYLQMLIQFEKWEKQNSRRAGRLSLKSYLQNLCIAIIAQDKPARHG